MIQKTFFHSNYIRFDNFPNFYQNINITPNSIAPIAFGFIDSFQFKPAKILKFKINYFDFMTLNTPEFNNFDSKLILTNGDCPLIDVDGSGLNPINTENPILYITELNTKIQVQVVNNVSLARITLKNPKGFLTKSFLANEDKFVLYFINGGSNITPVPTKNINIGYEVLYTNEIE